jgi:hypothetical protein
MLSDGLFLSQQRKEQRMVEIDRIRMKAALAKWVKKHNITIVSFSEKMEYTYTHAWGVLRGKLEFTTETFGRFVLAYGLNAGRELMVLAGYPDEIIDPQNLDAQKVPVVYLDAQESA